ncbi:protein of unknown function (plasmid) [Streptantibioticus cattleyicolor NRRL 8057 = DSM 46488]|nr:protein of unknown function [Streptantibioticus cattleyicolor NRRL 8057 = DSM 46488]
MQLDHQQKVGRTGDGHAHTGLRPATQFHTGPLQLVAGDRQPQRQLRGPAAFPTGEVGPEGQHAPPHQRGHPPPDLVLRHAESTRQVLVARPAVMLKRQVQLALGRVEHQRPLGEALILPGFRPGHRTPLVAVDRPQPPPRPAEPSGPDMGPRPYRSGHPRNLVQQQRAEGRHVPGEDHRVDGVLATGEVDAGHLRQRRQRPPHLVRPSGTHLDLAHPERHRQPWPGHRGHPRVTRGDQPPPATRGRPRGDPQRGPQPLEAHPRIDVQGVQQGHVDFVNRVLPRLVHTGHYRARRSGDGARTKWKPPRHTERNRRRYGTVECGRSTVPAGESAEGVDTRRSDVRRNLTRTRSTLVIRHSKRPGTAPGSFPPPPGAG